MGDVVRGSDFVLQDLPAPQLRKDPVTGRWTIFSTERARRPEQPPGVPEVCPFCEGNERETPPEVLALRDPASGPNQPGWRLRVVPNRYAAVRPGTLPTARTDGLFEQIGGIGSHEVVIECAPHESSIARLPVEHLREVVRVWRDRTLAHKDNPALRYVKVFKNKGAEAGASLEHSHSQIIALPVVPGQTQEELDSADRYFATGGRCVFCELVAQERSAGERVVRETERFLAVTAFAGRWPFETWILPRSHLSHFESAPDADLDDLATVLHDLLGRFDRALCEPPYNLVLHTAPLHAPASAAYHWHIELLPRLTQPAGFEWGTGWHINPVPPEQGAAYLRAAPAR